MQKSSIPSKLRKHEEGPFHRKPNPIILMMNSIKKKMKKIISNCFKIRLTSESCDENGSLKERTRQTDKKN